jgi:cysteinyl-tRNA synthetase
MKMKLHKPKRSQDKPFARYWMHNGMLQLKGEKMSKSTGNLVPINEFIRDHSGDVMRLIVLSSYYRSPLTFNSDVVEANERALERLLSAKRPASPDASGAPADVLARLAAQVETTRKGFTEAMDEDFNTAGALGLIFDLVRAINQARAEDATDSELAEAQDIFIQLTEVFGLELNEPEHAGTSADAFIDLLLVLREDLRGQKLYELSDRIRDELLKLGVVIEDTPRARPGVGSKRWANGSLLAIQSMRSCGPNAGRSITCGLQKKHRSVAAWQRLSSLPGHEKFL